MHRRVSFIIAFYSLFSLPSIHPSLSSASFLWVLSKFLFLLSFVSFLFLIGEKNRRMQFFPRVVHLSLRLLSVETNEDRVGGPFSLPVSQSMYCVYMWPLAPLRGQSASRVDLLLLVLALKIHSFSSSSFTCLFCVCFYCVLFHCLFIYSFISALTHLFYFWFAVFGVVFVRWF